MYQDVKFIKGTLYYEEQDGKWYPFQLPIVGGGGGRGARGAQGPQGIQGPAGAAGGFVPAVTDASLTGDGSALDPLGLPYKLYVALLYQEDLNAPTAIVLENTLGFVPVYSYNAVGSYLITQANGFPLGKTIILSSQSTTGKIIWFDHENGADQSNIAISTQDNANVQQNNILLGTSIEIRVYP